MRPETVDSFYLKLYGCISVREGGAASALAAARAAGGEFVTWTTDGYRPAPEPLTKADESGNFVRYDVKYCHPALQPDRVLLHDIRFRNLAADTPPCGYYHTLPGSRGSVAFSQDALFEDQRLVDPLALGQLRLACDLIPLLGPTYGWLDESGYNTPSEGRGGFDPNDLRFVFWANVFGPAHVAALGRDFLAAAPCWRLVELPGGGLLYVVSENYREWWTEDRLDVLAHFRKRVPGIELYRSEPSPY